MRAFATLPIHTYGIINDAEKLNIYVDILTILCKTKKKKSEKHRYLQKGDIFQIRSMF